VSQNRPAADQIGVVAGLRSESDVTMATHVAERARRAE